MDTTLNARQEQYLKVIFEIDQQEETANRAGWNKGQRVAPASEFRWITYNPTTSTPSRLFLMLYPELVDNGTGSTFKALAERELIEYRDGPPLSAIFYVKLTAKGRKLARELTGTTAPKRLPTGTLQDYQWQALTDAYNAGADGLKYDGIGRYGKFKWQTVWLRLRDYKLNGKPYPLVDDTGGVLRISERGKEFYRQNLEKYQELYPTTENEPDELANRPTQLDDSPTQPEQTNQTPDEGDESETLPAHTTYRQEMIKCGNARCKKCTEGQRGHGPYWYAYIHQDGKTKKKYIGKNAPAGAITKTATTNQEPAAIQQAEQQPTAAPTFNTNQSRRGRPPKQPPLHFWLFEETDIEVLGFPTRELAEHWAARMKVKTKIYEADDKTAARQQHWKFLNAWANGRASWN